MSKFECETGKCHPGQILCADCVAEMECEDDKPTVKVIKVFPALSPIALPSTHRKSSIGASKSFQDWIEELGGEVL